MYSRFVVPEDLETLIVPILPEPVKRFPHSTKLSPTEELRTITSKASYSLFVVSSTETKK